MSISAILACFFPPFGKVLDQARASAKPCVFFLLAENFLYGERFVEARLAGGAVAEGLDDRFATPDVESFCFFFTSGSFQHSLVRAISSDSPADRDFFGFAFLLVGVDAGSP